MRTGCLRHFLMVSEFSETKEGKKVRRESKEKHSMAFEIKSRKQAEYDAMEKMHSKEASRRFKEKPYAMRGEQN